jgi:hypothetical protein
MNFTSHPLLQAVGIFVLVIAYLGPISGAIYMGWNWRYVKLEYRRPIKLALWITAIFGFICFAIGGNGPGPNPFESAVCLGLGIWLLAIPVCVGFFWDCHLLSDWEGAAMRRMHGSDD